VKYSVSILLSVCLAIACCASAQAQRLDVDHGERIGGLWCFPVSDAADTYVYLPMSARLGTGDNGKPQFAFIRYVINEDAHPADESHSIVAAEGGGILTFTVQYDTPSELIRDAEAALREKYKKDAIRIRGPIVFSSANYSLVSSILQEDRQKPERKLLATGVAPVLEGNVMAFSFSLTPQASTLLMRSFEMDTPDVSLVFSLEFQGLTDAYDADLRINWSEVAKSEGFSAGGSLYFVSADVENNMKQLLRNNAIQLVSRGSDAQMEALLARVYDKLLELMFRPAQLDQIPSEQRGGISDAIAGLLNTRSGALSSRNTTGFGLRGAYQRKELRTDGNSVLSFNHRAVATRNHFITFNMGDFQRRYGSDPAVFRTVNLGDPVFRQRTVKIGIDGSLHKELEKAINNASVTLRKIHENGEITLEEAVVDKAVASTNSDLKFVYGWKEDNNRLAWLDYDYRCKWSFSGGGVYETEWTHANSPMINLFAPYEYMTVQIVGDPAAMENAGIRAVAVRIEYPFFSQTREERLTVRPSKMDGNEQLELTVPLGKYTYSYAVTWITTRGERREKTGTDNTGILFVDELPKE
jgi:hypothetical protein